MAFLFSFYPQLSAQENKGLKRFAIGPIEEIIV